MRVGISSIEVNGQKVTLDGWSFSSTTDQWTRHIYINPDRTNPPSPTIPTFIRHRFDVLSNCCPSTCRRRCSMDEFNQKVSCDEFVEVLPNDKGRYCNGIKIMRCLMRNEKLPWRCSSSIYLSIHFVVARPIVYSFGLQFWSDFKQAPTNLTFDNMLVAPRHYQSLLNFRSNICRF